MLKAYKYIQIAFIPTLIAVSIIGYANANITETPAALTVPALGVARNVNLIHDTVDTNEVINEEASRYNFASIQSGSNLKVTAGSEINCQINFYNVDGNRTTHITLEVVGAPEGCVVEVDSEVTAEVSELTSEPARDLEEGVKSVVLGSRGYTVAKIANITINVPEDTEDGAIEEIRITTKAEWNDQSGQVVICQTRDFHYSVEVWE